MNATQACAPSHSKVDWPSIDWAKCQQSVRRLQVRMVKAHQQGKPGKVKALQWLLTHSFSAKALAVKRVTENQGKNTPGVDGELWLSPEAKANAITKLKRHGYKPQPARRVLIPKSSGGKRPLSIPTMTDRAMQALHLLALKPLAETTADPNSYGFRRERSPADAIEQCFKTLAGKHAAQWILEGDIRSCFDTISHSWMMNHIPTDKGTLKKWLKAGVMTGNTLYPTEAGVPQGSPISPVLANLTLDGLEALLAKAFPPRRVNGVLERPKVHLIRYADDFIITGRSKELLASEVKPLVERFLNKRGLQLSPGKTTITHISQGFDFLGQSIRKMNGKLLIKPSKKSVASVLAQARTIIKKHRTARQHDLILKLNPLLRGWVNYHRHVIAKKTFVFVDHVIWMMLWQWAKRRHPGKSRYWIKDKYFKVEKTRKWVFASDDSGTPANGMPKRTRLVRASDTPIRRHIKIRMDANPFDPAWDSYFEARHTRRMRDSLRGKKKLLALINAQQGRCAYCYQLISTETRWHVHHLKARARGGDDRQENLVMLHPVCHQQVHSLGLNLVKPAPQGGL